MACSILGALAVGVGLAIFLLAFINLVWRGYHGLEPAIKHHGSQGVPIFDGLDGSNNSSIGRLRDAIPSRQRRFRAEQVEFGADMNHTLLDAQPVPLPTGFK